MNFGFFVTSSNVWVPIYLPYHSDWKDFEDYEGEIEVDGIDYHYVKRKVEKDHLLLLCLPNTEKQLIQSSRDQFFRLVNDIDQSQDQKGTQPAHSSGKQLSSVYQPTAQTWSLGSLSIERASFALYHTSMFTSALPDALERPPQA